MPTLGYIQCRDRQSEPMSGSMWLRSLVDVVAECLKDSIPSVIMANAIEWTSNQRAFKDSKVAQNVLRLTLCVRGGRKFKLKNWKILVFCVETLKSHHSCKSWHKPGGFHPQNKTGPILIVIVSRPDTDCGVSHERKQVSDLYERPPTVDFRSSKCCHENGFASNYTAACCSCWWSPHCDKSQICKWQSNCELSGTDEPVFLLSPCFIRAAYCGFILHNNLAG